MGLLSKIKLNLATRLKDRSYRTRFFRDRTQQEIAIQLREVRALRKLRQADLARLCRMKQSAISRIEQATYSSWTFKTLLRVAASLDVRVRVVFEPMEKVVEEYREREKSLVYVRGITIPNFHFQQGLEHNIGLFISGTTTFTNQIGAARSIVSYPILGNIEESAWAEDRPTPGHSSWKLPRLSQREAIGHG